ncbi:MAG: VWA domain-containing protein [Hyphomonadaceae bacterium]|nr:VWA domain-containing protein [Hyphomonadaceae bacterium]
MHAYILLDRTGSMQSLWDEALGAVNVYVEALGDAHVTMAVFDAVDGLQFDLLRTGVPAATWVPVTSADATPRGMTPLFDAIGRIVARAEQDDPDKAVLVIMTDGAENASREMKKDDVKAALARVEKRGWQVVFLGADFAKFSDADAVGLARGQQLAMATGQMSGSMLRMAAKSRAYFDKNVQMAFDAEDRAEAGEADVQRRKGS